MELDFNKIQMSMARGCLTKSGLADRYGCSTARMHEILGVIKEGQTIQPITAGKLAKALNVDITEIMK